ncbi:MAG TPA: hypothetical protein VJK04_03760 [Candidatus Paceibacterota bacterium]
MKMQNIFKVSSIKSGLAIGAVALALPILAFAQPATGITRPQNPPPIPGFGIDWVIGILNTVVKWTFTVFLIVAVIFIIIAAFRYLFSGGDPAAVKKATQTVVFAAVAIAVALLSVSIEFLIRQLLSVS